MLKRRTGEAPIAGAERGVSTCAVAGSSPTVQADSMTVASRSNGEDVMGKHAQGIVLPVSRSERPGRAKRQRVISYASSKPAFTAFSGEQIVQVKQRAIDALNKSYFSLSSEAMEGIHHGLILGALRRVVECAIERSARQPIDEIKTCITTFLHDTCTELQKHSFIIDERLPDFCATSIVKEVYAYHFEITPLGKSERRIGKNCTPKAVAASTMAEGEMPLINQYVVEENSTETVRSPQAPKLPVGPELPTEASVSAVAAAGFFASLSDSEDESSLSPVNPTGFIGF